MARLANTREKFALQVVQRLRTAGFTAYFAGGCVRDRLLGVVPKDYDVATNALPDQVREAFGRRRTIAVGASFGVITVLGPQQVGHIEVATFRRDGTYSDRRHPDRVVFSSPEEDAARRDFTINGMFFDPVTNQVIDFVNGQADLTSKLIRAIGSPYKRISEDHLRMLRAVRFAATYGFEIEDEMFNAIKQQAENIVSVSQERITNELDRMLCHRSRRRSIELLVTSGLMVKVLPEVGTLANEDPQKWSRLLAIIDSLSNPSWATLIATLFGSQGVGLIADAVDETCRRLKVSNEVRKTAHWIAANLSVFTKTKESPFSQLQPLLIHDDVEQALSLATAVTEIDNDSRAADNLKACRELLRLPVDQLNPSPLLRGEDLRNLKITPGPVFAKILALVRNAQLDGELMTRQEALNMARSLANELT